MSVSPMKAERRDAAAGLAQESPGPKSVTGLLAQLLG